MRILVINPNTSIGVTRSIAMAANAAASPGDVIETMAAPFGPQLIVTEEDAAVAGRAVVTLAERMASGFDGIVIASFGDTAIAEVRARVPIPVVGIARCAFLAALAFGETFSIVSFSRAVAPSLRAVVGENGFTDRLASLRVLEESRWSDPGEIGSELIEPLIELCVQTQADGCGSIVMGGGPLASLAGKIAPHVAVPVIDGVDAAVRILKTSSCSRQSGRLMRPL
jgi:allantoin racemase